VESATLPLLVDPMLATMATSSSTMAYLANPDVAVYWNTARTVESCVTWRQNFSSTDTDVWVRFYRDHQVASYWPGPGDLIPIDITTTAWEAPRVAAVFGPTNWTYLVVAQCSNGFVSPWWIGGRLLPWEFPFTFPNRPQFVISPPGNDCTNPDVGGGDAYEFMNATFTVVYEYAYSGNDHDIHARQVDGAGNVLAGTRFIDTSTAFESRPRIASKAGIHSSTKWPITYRRGTAGGFDLDVRGGYLGADGQATHLFAVATGGNYDHEPAVSSFTLNNHAMFVWERVGGGDNEIFGAVFDSTGAFRTSADLNRLEDPVGSRPAWAQFSPSVDSDGVRFAVAYGEYYQNSPSDPDANVGTFVYDAGANQLTCIEPHAYLAGTFLREYAPAIAAARPYPVYYNTSHKFVAACQRDDFNSGTTSEILSFLYDGAMPGGYTRRATGCGSGVTINDPREPGAIFAVEPQLGETIEFSMNGPPGFQLIWFGFPLSVALPGCPGCTVGVNGVVMSSPSQWTVPISGWLVGVRLSVQGVSFAGGTCGGSLALTDTVDFALQ
jgi:hypothetical protein